MYTQVTNYISKAEDYLYFVFRVFVGLLFFQHGAQKLFGWFGGDVVNLFTRYGAAGIIELVAGIFIAVGLLTRVAAVFGIADMIGAYILTHAPNGLIPIMNRGELALLYLAAFLVILAYGSKKWGLDDFFCKDK